MHVRRALICLIKSSIIDDMLHYSVIKPILSNPENMADLNVLLEQTVQFALEITKV